MPYLAAMPRVGSSSRPTSEKTSTPSIFLIASRCFWAKAPAPASTIFKNDPHCASARIFQNQMAHRRIGGRHMLKAMQLADLGVERTAHDQPHHEFDAFGARLTDVIDVRDTCCGVRVFGQRIEETSIEILIDHSGARTL